jgi:hypothetical protein
MEPKKVGRTLGIGVRVASNMVRQRVEQAAAQRSASPVSSEPGISSSPAPEPVPIGRKIGGQAANARRGIRAFFRAFLAPFTHAGGILWLEITGLFFALFALFFVQSVYRLRTAWSSGERAYLLLYIVLAIGFAWFSVSSFLRARRKTKRGPYGRR